MFHGKILMAREQLLQLTSWLREADESQRKVLESLIYEQFEPFVDGKELLTKALLRQVQIAIMNTFEENAIGSPHWKTLRCRLLSTFGNHGLRTIAH
jgi:hypothetical protein